MSQDKPPVPATRGLDRELRVGLFVLAGAAAVVIALYTMTDASMFRGRYIIRTTVPDAGGIRRGDPVQMRGVNIGRVLGFTLLGPEQVSVRLEIEGEFEIPSDSSAVLKSGLEMGNPLGSMVMVILRGTATTNLLNGDEIPGQGSKAFTETASKLANRAQTVLDRTANLLSDKTISNVEQGAEELKQLLKELSSLTSEQRRELKTLEDKLRQTVEGIDKTARLPELETAIKRLDTLTARLDTVTASFDRSSRSVESILGRIDRGEGTLGKLSKDETLYVDLDRAAANLAGAANEMKNLAEDIKRQPKKYLKVSVF